VRFGFAAKPMFLRQSRFPEDGTFARFRALSVRIGGLN
jgi:hypothetical protein